MRPIQRVDHPQPALLRVGHRAQSLFRKHAVLRKLIPQAFEDGALHGEVCLGHEVATALPARLSALPAGLPWEAIQQDARGLLGALAHDLFRAVARS